MYGIDVLDTSFVTSKKDEDKVKGVSSLVQ